MRRCCVVPAQVHEGCERSVITYSALINACEKASQWELALQLFERMQQEGIAPNTVTYNSLITACMQGALAYAPCLTMHCHAMHFSGSLLFCWGGCHACGQQLWSWPSTAITGFRVYGDSSQTWQHSHQADGHTNSCHHVLSEYPPPNSNATLAPRRRPVGEGLRGLRPHALPELPPRHRHLQRAHQRL